jgi:hypothetical protein
MDRIAIIVYLHCSVLDLWHWICVILHVLFNWQWTCHRVNLWQVAATLNTLSKHYLQFHRNLEQTGHPLLFCLSLSPNENLCWKMLTIQYILYRYGMLLIFHLRIFHSYGDITIAANEELQNLGPCSSFRALKQGGIFIVPHLPWHGASVYLFSS